MNHTKRDGYTEEEEKIILECIKKYDKYRDKWAYHAHELLPNRSIMSLTVHASRMRRVNAKINSEGRIEKELSTGMTWTMDEERIIAKCLGNRYWARNVHYNLPYRTTSSVRAHYYLMNKNGFDYDKLAKEDSRRED